MNPVEHLTDAEFCDVIFKECHRRKWLIGRKVLYPVQKEPGHTLYWLWHDIQHAAFKAGKAFGVKEQPAPK